MALALAFTLQTSTTDPTTALLRAKDQALLDAVDIQIKLECTGGDVVEIPAAICAKTAEQYEHHDSGRGSHDWAAYLRVLDSIDTSYRN